MSVKGGGINPSMVRDLVGTIESEKADMGIFAMLNEPTLKMRQAAMAAGQFKTILSNYQRVQIWTAADHFAGRLPDLPGGGDLPKATRMGTALPGTQSTL